MSIAEGAIPFWRKGLTACDMLKCVDSMRGQDVLTAHVGFTNVVTTVSRRAVDEVVYGSELPENCGKWIGQPEQKSVLLVKDVVHKFFKPGKLVLRSICMDSPTAKKCYCWTSI